MEIESAWGNVNIRRLLGTPGFVMLAISKIERRMQKKQYEAKYAENDGLIRL